MAKACDHEIRETKRGAGACRIVAEVRKRNGRPNWWCHTHGMAASAPDGNALERCPGAWFDPIPEDQCLELDLVEGEVAIWGALSAAIEIGDVPDDPGKVHVHRRTSADQHKDIDESYDLVTIRNGDREVVVEGMAAVAFSISELAGRTVTPLTCPHCGEVHIDELKFATFPHSKHLCNSCGRNFRDKSPSISNPLAEVAKDLGLPQPSPAERAHQSLDLSSSAYSAIALWPSNSAILSTMSRPEEEGIHVHAWGAYGELIIDDTYSPVTVDDIEIDEDRLRVLAIQRALAHGAPVQSKPCGYCGHSLTSPTDTWLEPVTSHTCAHCGEVTKTRQRVFLNPLVELFDTKHS